MNTIRPKLLAFILLLSFSVSLINAPVALSWSGNRLDAVVGAIGSANCESVPRETADIRRVISAIPDDATPTDIGISNRIISARGLDPNAPLIEQYEDGAFDIFKSTACDVVVAVVDYGGTLAGDIDAGTGPAEGVGSIGNTEDGASAVDDDDIVCVGGPLGYITCPLIGIASKMVQGIANFLGNLFNFQALNNSGLRESWGLFTNLANIILAIAFLVVVISQASSIGISNYGVKRILPRVIAGAILINLSFFVCALAIDVSNVLGRNMLEFTASLSANVEGGGVSGGSTSGGAGEDQRECGDRKAKYIVGQKVACFFDIIEIGMAGGFLVATIFIFVMLIATFISFTITLALVIMRYVILIFLVLLAPLAFAAWVLPNTEQYFQKWWSMFLKMLLIYPAAMFLFGGSLFVADILADINIGEMFNDTGLPTEVMQAMMASFQLFVIAMPLFFIPKLFKGMDSVTGGLAGKMAAMGSAGAAYKLGKKGAKMGGKAAAPYAKFGAANLTDKMANSSGRVGRFTRGARTRLDSGRARKLAINQSLEARKAGKQASAQEKAAEIGLGSDRLSSVGGDRYKEFMYQKQDSAEQERVKAKQAQYARSNLLDLNHMLDEMRQAKSEGDNVKLQAAAGIVASKFGSPGVNALHEEITNPDANWTKDQAKALTRVTEAHYSGITPKRADLAKGYFEEKDGAVQFTQGKLKAADPSTQLSNNVNAWVDAVKTGNAPDQKQAITLATGQKPADSAAVQHIIHEIASGRGEELKVSIERGDFNKEVVSPTGKTEVVFDPEKVPTASHGSWSPASTPLTRRVSEDTPSHGDFSDRDG